MKNSTMKFQRRDFLKIGAIGMASLAVAGQAGKAVHAADAHVDENDTSAQALGYKHDATKVDKAKFPNYKPGETCANCQLFQAKPGAAWGPCPLFAGKEVNAKGWCSAYAKKV
jgi:hypothetical protein